MTGFNFIGLALGPLLAGPLIEYAPHPARLPFAAYLGVVLVVGLLVAKPTLALRLGVPRGVRAAFIAPAAAGFAAMAVVVFYAALGPTTMLALRLTDALHTRPAAGSPRWRRGLLTVSKVRHSLKSCCEKTSSRGCATTGSPRRPSAWRSPSSSS